MSDEFGFGQRAEISILREISHFRVCFSLALLICRLGLSHSLSLLLILFLFRLSALRVRWCQPTTPWNRVVSGWLRVWTLFLSGPSWVTGWVTACLFPCYVAYCLWSNFYFIILALQLSIPRGSEYFQRVVREREICMWHTHTTIKKYFISSYTYVMFICDVRWSFVLHHFALVILLDILIILVLLCFILQELTKARPLS